MSQLLCKFNLANMRGNETTAIQHKDHRVRRIQVNVHGSVKVLT